MLLYRKVFFRQESTGSNSISATGLQKRDNWPCSLGGRGGVLLSPVNQSNTNRLYVSSCMWKMELSAFLQCVKLPCDVRHDHQSEKMRLVGSPCLRGSMC